jgi:hypothetical protein
MIAKDKVAGFWNNRKPYAEKWLHQNRFFNRLLWAVVISAEVEVC